MRSGEGFAAIDHELDLHMHLFPLNRGLLMRHFHNMILICPDIEREDVVYDEKVLRAAVISLFA